MQTTQLKPNLWIISVSALTTYMTEQTYIVEVYLNNSFIVNIIALTHAENLML